MDEQQLSLFQLRGLNTHELGKLLLRYPPLEVRTGRFDEEPIPVSVVRIRDHYNPNRDKIEIFVEVL